MTVHIHSVLMLSITFSPAGCSESESWQAYFSSQLSWAHQQPWTFLIIILLLLSPFFGYSAMLSLRLNQQIQDIYDQKILPEKKKNS